MHKFNQTTDQKQVESKKICTLCTPKVNKLKGNLTFANLYPLEKENELRQAFHYSELLAFYELLRYDTKENLFEACKNLLLLNFEENNLDLHKDLKSFLVTIYYFFEALYLNENLCELCE
jgi:hypothetical protein